MILIAKRRLREKLEMICGKLRKFQTYDYSLGLSIFHSRKKIQSLLQYYPVIEL